ncbi:MAG: hypothetical protein CL483_13670 [Acidobacteria bacterium]|nr:hypothetical protein [Acidobacteriota bacterium]
MAETVVSRGSSTLALLVAALAMGAYIYLVESDRDPAAPEALESVFDLDSNAISALTVTAENGERTVLRKTDERWQIVEPFQTNVDVTQVVGLTSGLASLELQRVVLEPEDAPDLSQFGLSPPRVSIEVEAGALDSALFIGDETPTGGDLYAAVEGSNRVFLISGYLDGTFNRTMFALRDKTLLSFTRNQVNGLELTGADLSIRLRKTADQWALTEPFEAHADLAVTDGLIGRLATDQMVAIDTERATDLEPYGLSTPTVTTRVLLGEESATLLVGTPAPDGSVWAKDASRDMVFSIEATLADELARAAVEYRRKNLFGFRPFNATRLEFEIDDTQHVFEQQAADGVDEAVWRRLEPRSQDVGDGGLDDLLAQLSNLRAERFVDTREGTGLDGPSASVIVTFDDPSRQEKVSIGRGNGQVFAVNGEEIGAAVVTTRSWDDIVAALDALRPD